MLSYLMLIFDTSPHVITNVGVILLVGYIFGKLAEKVKVPAITGYLLAGLLLGPITQFISIEDTKSMKIVSEVALGFIAFQVGNELWFGKLKYTGIKILIITIIQAIMTSMIVFLLLLIVTDVTIALILGAIAAATAPAPIMMLINKYRTKGELTETIVPIVGLDDAVGVILFSILLSIGIGISVTTGSSGIAMLIEPVIEITLSILIGGIIGGVSGIIIRTMRDNSEKKENNLEIVIITVFATTGIAITFGASPILTPMIAGMVVTNLINKETYVLENENIRFFIPIIMIAFFTIAGAELQFDVILSAGLIGVVYIIGRTIGKMFGCFIGTTITKSSSKVKKYLGIGMLPQSGVAIGLSVAAYNEISMINIDYANTIKNVVLASVLFFALIGPVLVKIAFYKSGELVPSKSEELNNG